MSAPPARAARPVLDLGLRRWRLSRQGRVLVAAFDNPPLNFLDAAAVAELERLVVGADRDASVGAVVLTGAPEDRFITHFDVGELAAAARPPAPALGPRLATAVVAAGLLATATGWSRTAAARLGPLGRSLVTLARLHRIIHRMHRSGVVWVAAVNGPCLGAGLELALACDLRLAADAAGVTFAQPEVLAGILPGAGGTQHLPRVVGTARALRIIIEGEPLGPQDAVRLGLVERAVPPDELRAEAVALADRWGSRPRRGVAAAKRAVYVGAARGLRAGLLVEAGGLVCAGPDPVSRRLATAFEQDLHRLGDSPFVAEPGPWVSGDRADAARWPGTAGRAG